MSIGDFPESLSQAMLVGIMLVGRLGGLHRSLEHARTSGAVVYIERDGKEQPFCSILILAIFYPPLK